MANTTVHSARHDVPGSAFSLHKLVSSQLAALRTERERLAGLLRERETDLEQLKVLLDDLLYAHPGQHGGGGPGWVAHLESLQETDVRLREEIHRLDKAVAYLSELDNALSAVPRPDERRDRPVATDGPGPGLTSRVLHARELERSRLAREVHDGPAQVLANSIMALEYCERLLEKRPEVVPGELRRVKGTMSEGLEEVRRFIFDLRPNSLKYEGLVATLRRYARDFERHGLDLQLTADDVDAVLTDEQRFALFRIVQEAMQNCRKHAHASKVAIRLTRRGPCVEVRVHDNGRGFEAAAPAASGHYGLQNMTERAVAVRGTVSLTSKPGAGTVVMVRVPVEPG